MNKLNLEIQKINKETHKIEWTNTIEIPYEKKEKIINENQPEQSKIEEIKINDVSTLDSQTNINQPKEEIKQIKEIKLNPFHEPDMNTLEFEDSENFVLVNISKTNPVESDNQEINQNEKLIALDKLLAENIITKKEYEKKKAKIMQDK